MSGFSNFAICFSIICILAGGITSFHLGLCGVGGAGDRPRLAAGCACSRWSSRATMGQVASAFPTAGGLYHWALDPRRPRLGLGRPPGSTSPGLVTVLAAINVGTYLFVARRLRPVARLRRRLPATQVVVVAVITASQALVQPPRHPRRRRG